LCDPGKDGDASLRRISRDGESVVPVKGAGDWLDITPDGKTLITEPPATDDQWPRIVDSLLVWDLVSGKRRHTIPVAHFHPRAASDNLMFLDDSRSLLIIHGNPRPGDLLGVWDLETQNWLGEVALGKRYPVVIPDHDLFALVTQPQESPAAITMYRPSPFEKLWQRDWPDRMLHAFDVRAGADSLLVFPAPNPPKKSQALESLDLVFGDFRFAIDLDRDAGPSWYSAEGKVLVTEWHDDQSERNPVRRWLEAKVLPMLFPNLPPRGRTSTSTRIVDAESGIEQCRIESDEAHPCGLSSDGRLLFLYQEAPSGGEARLLCYDVPPRRAWKYIGGIPAAIGLVALSGNVGWRRWRARKARRSAPCTVPSPAPGREP
jgi:hypothetical protein